jgi:prevent-host-death family protein
MTTVTITEARTKLFQLIDEVVASHQPVLITGKQGNAILVAEEDWHAIEETMYLLSIPGMRESIKKGLETPLEDCVDTL